jgi:hypothetical protein
MALHRARGRRPPLRRGRRYRQTAERLQWARCLRLRVAFKLQRCLQEQLRRAR